MRNEMPDRANVPEVCTTEPKHVNLAHAIDGYASVVHALQNLVDRISNCEENLKDYESNYPSLEEVLNNPIIFMLSIS